MNRMNQKMSIVWPEAAKHTSQQKAVVITKYDILGHLDYIGADGTIILKSVLNTVQHKSLFGSLRIIL
jgi:hypothetical protein